MILVFILTHNLSKLVHSLQCKPLMLEGISLVTEENFSENQGISHIYHGKISLLSQRFSLNPPNCPEEGPSQRNATALLSQGGVRTHEEPYWNTEMPRNFH